MEKYQEKKIEKLFRTINVVFLSVALAGCGGGRMMMTPPTVTMNTSFAFVANTNSNTVSAFQVDSQSGTLFPISGGHLSDRLGTRIHGPRLREQVFVRGELEFKRCIGLRDRRDEREFDSGAGLALPRGHTAERFGSGFERESSVRRQQRQ
jgi:hypothetical protein